VQRGQEQKKRVENLQTGISGRRKTTTWESERGTKSEETQGILPGKGLFYKIYYYPSSNPPSNGGTNLVCKSAGSTD
jgi:hypothetical protein